MIENEDDLQELVRQSEQRASRRRRNVLLFTLIPALAAIGFLLVTASQVQQASQAATAPQTELAYNQKTLAVAQAPQTELAYTQKTLAVAKTSLAEPTTAGAIAPQSTLVEMQADINQLQMTVASQNSQLDFTKLALKDSYYQGDLKQVLEYTQRLEAAQKILPGPARLLDLILANLKVPWKTNGVMFLEGVNSPTYAAQILDLPPRFKSIDQGTLMKLIPLKKERPQIGDVVYYDGGYSLFYFVDEKGQDLVVGMTPLGVVALNYDFAKPVAFGDPFR